MSSESLVLALSAGVVGFVHSLAPAHWIPISLIAKSQKWTVRQSIFGAFFAGLGHVIVSLAIVSVVLSLGAHFVADFEEEIERYAFLGLILFGLIYAAWAWKSHSHCIGHSHHGPDPAKRDRRPYLFLFFAGFTPCIAVLPVFISVFPYGVGALLFTAAVFCIGVFLSLFSVTTLVNLSAAKFLRLDHPVLEHHGELITGLAIALLGLILFFLPHHH